MYYKSPIFYMGNKYDLLNNLIAQFPDNEEIENFIDLFGGSGTVSLNVNYKNIYYNELNPHICNLLKLFSEYSYEEIVNHIESRIKEFNLPSVGHRYDLTKEQEDKEKENYNTFRAFYNKNERNYLDLLTLAYFSFCNQIRFNSNGDFNMPRGNQYFLNEHKILISNACKNVKKISILNKNAFDILSEIKEKSNTFIYLDPPYSNTTAIYNEKRANGGWEIEDDLKLFEELNRISKLGIKWAMSNVLKNKDKENSHIEKWAKDNGYYIIDIEDKSYSAFGKGNAKSREVLITNYLPRLEQLKLF